MNNVQPMIDGVLGYVQSSFSMVNAWQGLLVALIAVVVMKRWRQIFLATLVAALGYVLVEHFTPIVTAGAKLRLPDVTNGVFWQRLGAVYVGLFIIIGIFFGVKALVMRARGTSAPPAPKKK